MKKTLLLFFALILSFSLVFFCSCETNPNGKEEEEENTGEKGEPVLIVFQYGDAHTSNRYYKGTLPTPPELEDVDMGSYIIHFTGWDKPIVPVEGETTYVATYVTISQVAKATFIMGDKTEVVEHDFFKKPTPPQEIPSYNGMTFLCWDKALESTDQDVTYRAMYVDESLMDAASLKRAYDSPLMLYSSNVSDNDNAKSTMNRATSLFYLVWHEHLNPQGGQLVKRIVEHFTSVVSKDQAPAFDACCYWNYNPLSASLALARNTPTIWDAIPRDIQIRMDTMMWAFAYLESFATSDHNEYKTGPGLKGNYEKDWNPNYRLANVPVMIYATYYFGLGDIELGAQKVNDRLKAFDEDAYETILNTFTKYGWRRAKLTWNADARTSTDGRIQGESAKTLMIYGGQAVGDDTPTDSDLLVDLGTGTGVANRDPKTKKGRDYLYKTFKLSEPEKIVRHLINYNYGGANISLGSYESSSYKTVVSYHQYNGNVVAWIIDKTASPYEGEEGMMTEFASGNRSSTSYTSHDFILCTILLCATRAMETYTTDENGVRQPLKNADGTPKVVFDYTAPEEEALWNRVQIGNEDFIYKYVHGYQCYATGSYGESTNKGYEKDNKSNDYWISKNVWRTYMMQWGSVPIAESFGLPEEMS